MQVSVLTLTAWICATFLSFSLIWNPPLLAFQHRPEFACVVANHEVFHLDDDDDDGGGGGGDSGDSGDSGGHDDGHELCLNCNCIVRS